MALEPRCLARPARRLGHRAVLAAAAPGDPHLGPHRADGSRPVRARHLPGLPLPVRPQRDPGQGHRAQDEVGLAVGRGALPADVHRGERAVPGVPGPRSATCPSVASTSARSSPRRSTSPTRPTQEQVLLAEGRRGRPSRGRSTPATARDDRCGSHPPLLWVSQAFGGFAEVQDAYDSSRTGTSTRPARTSPSWHAGEGNPDVAPRHRDHPPARARPGRAAAPRGCRARGSASTPSSSSHRSAGIDIAYDPGYLADGPRAPARGRSGRSRSTTRAALIRSPARRRTVEFGAVRAPAATRPAGS